MTHESPVHALGSTIAMSGNGTSAAFTRRSLMSRSTPSSDISAWVTDVTDRPEADIECALRTV